jgi:hypothetical protein
MKELKTEQLDLIGGGFDPLNGPPIPPPQGGIDPALWEWLKRQQEQNQQQH